MRKIGRSRQPNERSHVGFGSWCSHKAHVRVGGYFFLSFSFPPRTLAVLREGSLEWLRGQRLCAPVYSSAALALDGIMRHVFSSRDRSLWCRVKRPSDFSSPVSQSAPTPAHRSATPNKNRDLMSTAFDTTKELYWVLHRVAALSSRLLAELRAAFERCNTWWYIAGRMRLPFSLSI